MKKLLYLAAISLLTFTCKDQHEIEQQQSKLNERVGSQISLETAERWTQRFNQRGVQQNSRQKSDEPIPSAYLYDYLTDIESKIGVAFHYGLDINNEIHVLVIKYNQDVRWEDTAFDTKTKSILDKASARELCDRFKSVNSEGPWSHFIGRDIIVSILEKQNFNSFQLIPAINDQNEKQLLLYVWLKEISNGRTLDQTLEVFDKTNPCPPVCPSES